MESPSVGFNSQSNNMKVSSFDKVRPKHHLNIVVCCPAGLHYLHPDGSCQCGSSTWSWSACWPPGSRYSLSPPGSRSSRPCSRSRSSRPCSRSRSSRPRPGSRCPQSLSSPWSSRSSRRTWSCVPCCARPRCCPRRPPRRSRRPPRPCCCPPRCPRRR